MKKSEGITLVSLIITIIILLILASVATYSGMNVVNSSKLTKFTTELKIMQTQVNAIYQEKSDSEIGEDIRNVQTQANKVFNEAGITSTDGYRYWSKQLIKQLGIEGVEQDFFVNVEQRSVVSYQGFEYNGKTYYTLDQLPNGLYNVEYNDKNISEDKPTFNTSVEKISENKWRVTVSNIQYNGYINKWKVNYQLEGQDSWSESEDLSFIVNEEGNYHIKIVNDNVQSEEKERPVWKRYVGKGMLLYLDGINNTRNGHDDNATTWEDLSGNSYDFIKLSSAQNAIWSENSYVGDGKNRTLYYNQAILADATECTIEVCYDVLRLADYDWVFQNREVDQPPNGFQFIVGRSGRRQSVFVNNEVKQGSGTGSCTDLGRRTMGIALNNQTIEFLNNAEFYSSDVDERYMQSVAQRSFYAIGGSQPWRNDISFNGNIYAIRIYNRKLSEAEISYNYEIDKLRFNLE